MGKGDPYFNIPGERERLIAIYTEHGIKQKNYDDFGCSYTTCRKELIRLGLYVPNTIPDTWTDKEYEQVEKILDCQEQIAAAMCNLDRTKSSINKKLSERRLLRYAASAQS